MNPLEAVTWTNIFVVAIILISAIVCLTIYNKSIETLPFYFKTMIFFSILTLIGYIFNIVSSYGMLVCKLSIACLIMNILLYTYSLTMKKTRMGLLVIIGFITIFLSMVFQILNLYFYRNLSIGVFLLSVGIKVFLLIFQKHEKVNAKDDINISDK